MKACFPALEIIVVASALLSCHRSPEEKKERARGPTAEPWTKGDAPDDATADRAAQHGPQHDATAVESIVHVPVGSFRVGSLPGEPGREPSAEALAHAMTLGPFRMDRRARVIAPASGQGDAGEAKAGFSFDAAQVSCAEAGGRLCTEVEWERACKGPGSTIYAGSDEACTKVACTSGYDVEGLGLSLEWTASSFSSTSPWHGERALRGAGAGVSDGERRCSRRTPESQKPKGEPVTFRCCYGAANAERLKDPEQRVPFRETDVALEDLRRLLDRDERTKELTADLSYFREDAASTVLARGPGDTMGFTLTTRPVVWSPERGVELLVVAGRAAERTAFVVAYFMAGDERVLAGSFIMKNEPGPIALAYASSIRPRMHFSGCWGCPGETGKLLFRPPESIVLLQP